MNTPALPLNAYKVLLLCTSLVVFDQFTVESVLKDPLYSNCVRDLDVVELWSGVGTVVAAGAALGLQALSFDGDCVPGDAENAEDTTSRVGFLQALSYIMRLKIGGLLHMAPACSSFGFANSNRCKRCGPDFEGDLLYDKVCEGNLIATISAFFMLLAHMRNVYASAENPSRSLYFNFRPVRMVFDALGLTYQVTDGCRFSNMRKGNRFLKSFMFAATGPWINHISRECNCPGRIHKQLMIKTAAGSRRGTPDLKKSQVYPKALGAAIVRAWTESANPTLPKPAKPSAKYMKKTLHKPAKPSAKSMNKTLPKPAKPSTKSVKKTLPKTAKPSSRSAKK